MQNGNRESISYHTHELEGPAKPNLPHVTADFNCLNRPTELHEALASDNQSIRVF